MCWGIGLQALEVFGAGVRPEPFLQLSHCYDRELHAVPVLGRGYPFDDALAALLLEALFDDAEPTQSSPMTMRYWFSTM